MDGWQPIETAPFDETVLIFIPGAAECLEYEIAHRSSNDPDSDWYCSTHDGGPIDMPPSHWMRLPEQPDIGRPLPHHGSGP